LKEIHAWPQDAVDDSRSAPKRGRQPATERGRRVKGQGKESLRAPIGERPYRGLRRKGKETPLNTMSNCSGRRGKEKSLHYHVRGGSVVVATNKKNSRLVTVGSLEEKNRGEGGREDILLKGELPPFTPMIEKSLVRRRKHDRLRRESLITTKGKLQKSNRGEKKREEILNLKSSERN